VTMTKSMANGFRIAREARRAERSGPYREAGNDSPRCPWIYRGYEEPPSVPAHPSGGTQDAGTLESRLRAIEQDICSTFRRRRHG
jgi:hypothetical protein